MYRNLKTTSSIMMKHLSKKRMHLLLSRHSLFGQATTFWSDKPLMLNKSLPHLQRLGPQQQFAERKARKRKEQRSEHFAKESSGSVNLSFYNLENMSSVLKTLMTYENMWESIQATHSKCHRLACIEACVLHTNQPVLLA